jgi:hypothetical protein
MLIVNNGVPKSGSTWVNKIVRDLVQPVRPHPRWQREGWQAASIARERIADYVASGEWRARPVLIKTHFEYGPDLAPLLQDGIRLVVTHRNLPDSVLSYWHHERRRGTAEADAMERWLKGRGMTFAEDMIRYYRSWADKPGALLVPYEEMVSDAAGQIARIAAHLGLEESAERIAAVAEGTQFRLKPGEAPREGAHARTGGLSRAEAELPAPILARLRRMEARRTGDPAAGPAAAGAGGA